MTIKIILDSYEDIEQIERGCVKYVNENKGNPCLIMSKITYNNLKGHPYFYGYRVAFDNDMEDKVVDIR